MADSFSLYGSFDMNGMQLFMTGILSPVSIASFTMADPVSKIMSHGSDMPSGTTTTSPGTNWTLSAVSV